SSREVGFEKRRVAEERGGARGQRMIARKVRLYGLREINREFEVAVAECGFCERDLNRRRSNLGMHCLGKRREGCESSASYEGTEGNAQCLFNGIQKIEPKDKSECEVPRFCLNV